jgi:hypothetical protein
MTGITAPLNLFSQGLTQVGNAQARGIQENLDAQKAALLAQTLGTSNVANQLLGPNGIDYSKLIDAGSKILGL